MKRVLRRSSRSAHGLWLALAACVLVLAGACDDGGSTPPKPPDRLVGTWEADLRQLFATRYSGPGNGAHMQGGLEHAYWRWELRRGGELIAERKLSGLESRESGRWEVLSKRGDEYNVRLSFEGGGVAFTEQPLRFEGDDRFTIRLSEGSGAEEWFTFHRRGVGGEPPATKQ